jgi:hypothetical protein
LILEKNHHSLFFLTLEDTAWKMIQLIEKQKFDGSWQLDGLSGLLDKPAEGIKESAVTKVRV